MIPTTDMNVAALSADLAAMMAGWSKIEEAARRAFPKADEEELYRICAGAMRHALGMA